MISAKVRLGEISYDGADLRIRYKTGFVGRIDSRIPVSSIAGVSAQKVFMGPTFVEFRVPGSQPTRHKQKHNPYGFSYKRKHAANVSAVLAAAGLTL